MRAILILPFLIFAFQASAEMRAECSITGAYKLRGSSLTEQADILETLYIQYTEETLSVSDGKFPVNFSASTKDETAGFIFSQNYIREDMERGSIGIAIIMNPACDNTLTSAGKPRTIHMYGLKWDSLSSLSANCLCEK